MHWQERAPSCWQVTTTKSDNKNVFPLQQIHAANLGPRYNGPGFNHIGLIMDNGVSYRQRESLIVPVFCMADTTRAVPFADLWDNANDKFHMSSAEFELRCAWIHGCVVNADLVCLWCQIDLRTIIKSGPIWDVQVKLTWMHVGTNAVWHWGCDFTWHLKGNSPQLSLISSWFW